MKRGFTIIELLVASLLLGMLVTILTMIFNQSSIAWRLGVASVADLDEARDGIAVLREDADNAFVCNNQAYRILGVWKDDGTLRTRACNVGGEAATQIAFSQIKGLNESSKASDMTPVSVGSGSSGDSFKNYTVNIMSAGPDREFGTYDDIWSWPDEFEE